MSRPASSLPEARAVQLRAPLTVLHVARRAFPPGPVMQSEIVTTNRLILVLRGELDYVIEKRTRTMAAGTMFLVPAWVRRSWTSSGRDGCEIAWCEFDLESGSGDQSGCELRVTSGPALVLEKQSFRNLRSAWLDETSDPIWKVLLLENTVKLMLIRFWPEANPAFSLRSAPSPAAPHPRIQEVLRWAEAHFHEPDALPAIYERSGMSPNYFRRLFTAALGCSPHAYLERLRLRQARYLMQSTDWQIKKVAAEVGYQDPLYFSRLYRRFWRRPPHRERLIGSSAR